MIHRLTELDNQEIDFTLHHENGKVKIKDIQLAIDEVEQFKRMYALSKEDIAGLDYFISCAKNAYTQYKILRELIIQAEDIKSDKFIDFVSNLNLPKKPDKNWKTYILIDKDSDFVKIGRTENIKQRLATLKNSSGRDLELFYLFNSNIEANLHDLFSEFRKSGEWFCVSIQTIIERVSNLKQIQPDIFLN